MKRFMLMTLLGILLLMIPASLLAAQDEGEIYVIKKGDTLWGLSERFIKDPNYWPSLWSNNPYIRNPHFIYPGQKVRIYDGRIEFLPEIVSPSPAAEPEPLPVAEDVVSLQATSGFEGFVSLEQYRSAGQIVDTIDNRIMVAEGDTVFVDMKDLASVSAGDLFSVFTEGRAVHHPVSGELLGYQVEERGTLILEELHAKVASGRILDSVREMERGAMLIPAAEPQKAVVLKKATREMAGYIVAARDLAETLSVNDIIYVDLGVAQGLEVGNMLHLTRARSASELGIDVRDEALPEQLLGAAVVVNVRQDTASALILKQVEPIYRGDRVRAVTR